MKRELGIARCGLVCCLCSENDSCQGCNSGNCGEKNCINRSCSQAKALKGCWECSEDCKLGLLQKIKPYGFTQYIKRYGTQQLLDRLEANEQAGVRYHISGIVGDYDYFDDVESLIRFIDMGFSRNGKPFGAI